MGVTIGPADWWARSAESIRPLAISCPVGTTLPDGSRIICKSGGGSAWIVAPNCTQVFSTWANWSIVGNVVGGDLPSISCWATLNTQLLNNGFNPCDWFVPCSALLVNPGYCCRTQWDTFSSLCYWSSTEYSAANAPRVCFANGTVDNLTKATAMYVRAFRCVTY